MNRNTTHRRRARRINGNGERGALTIFTAVLVLILMTLLLVYATRVGLFETRVSSNEVRQVTAFDAAEGSTDQGLMYLLSNSTRVFSSRDNVFPDGAGGFTGDGWFSATSPRWQPCPTTPAATHPCGGDVPATPGSFFYDTDGDTSTIETLPLDTSAFPADVTARLSALICFIDLADPTATPCVGAPTTPGEVAEASEVITLLAYGYSDCTDTTNVSTCTGAATTAKPISTFKKLSGTPALPMTTKTSFPPTGAVELVANPNGGGVGVPISTWINDNPDPLCAPTADISSSGSWQTCELQEWYQVDALPPGTTCTAVNCRCGPGGNDTNYFLSWRKASTNIGIDIVQDPQFPCDLFNYYFNVPEAEYQQIKDTAQIFGNCNGLGPQSAGLIWISGAECQLNANTVVGSPNNPVILVSAATDTVFSGGVNFYGVLYIFDGEDANASFEAKGTATVYGAVIVDAVIDKLNGTFQVVWSDNVLTNAGGIAGLGSVNGGWRDFGLPAIGW